MADDEHESLEERALEARALEARAYGASAPGAGRTAAQREWLQRREARQEAAEQAVAPSAGAADPSFPGAQDPAGPSEPADAPSDLASSPAETTRRRFSRGVVAGVAALALLVGTGVGVVAAVALVADGYFFAGSNEPQVDDSATGSGSTSDLLPTTGDPAETSRLAAGDAAVGADALQTTLEAADELLDRSATTADEYPISFDLNESFEEKSTRLITTAGTGSDVFVARAAEPAGGFCLLVAGRVRSAQDSSASVSCATRSDFATGGLTLVADDYAVTWIGGQVTVSVGQP